MSRYSQKFKEIIVELRQTDQSVSDIISLVIL